MVEMVDEKMVSELGRVFNLSTSRILWGQLEVAKKYWIRYLSQVKGVAELPYMTFFRTVRFLDQNRKAGFVDVIDFDGSSKSVKFIPVIFAYTIELLTAKVSEQNTAIRNFMLWAGSEGSISFKDENDVEWRCRVVAEDPEDSSDLESEEDYGRIVRTTFNVQVESMLLDMKGRSAPISDILLKVLGYYDNLDSAFDILELEIQVPPFEP